MSPYNRNQPFDPNIIEALNKLPRKMTNYDGKMISIRPNSGRETGVEHVSQSGHGLQEKDIKQIPNILKNPDTVCSDPDWPNRKNYYGKKYKEHVFWGFIKIVSDIKSDGSEEIVTVFLTKKIKKAKGK